MGAIDCNRSHGTKESNKKVLDQIKEYQLSVDRGENDKPLWIFPEGNTSNGNYLLSFKAGAFLAESSI